MDSKEYAQSPFEDFVTKPTHGFDEPTEDPGPIPWGTKAWGGRAPGDEVRPATDTYDGVGDAPPPKTRNWSKDIGEPGEPVSEGQWRHAMNRRVW